ncbi:adenylyl-sulfate kinase [Limnobacter parvus]|uniref:Adenylyl-sulfate kinase n=1 Tax=Limnobacter parvus TaxID=2939690 RepID=A0ABT1XCQ1_9BURK|nr:adenylyl-sulfate kinase [Limnobacter parvus]MCR2745063.1 adenylyl-sulfate kinase [Limnobacter parvus]
MNALAELPAVTHEQLKGHKAGIVWLTGLSGAGKSTIACELELRLRRAGVHTCVLDGDKLRHGLNADLGYSPQDRACNVQRTAHVAQLMADAGLLVIVAMISPYNEGRLYARSLVPSDQFLEVFVHAPLAVCEQRDPKGMYRQARLGLLPNFTGIDSAYETPTQPDLVLNTAETTVAACVQTLKMRLQQQGIWNCA